MMIFGKTPGCCFLTLRRLMLGLLIPALLISGCVRIPASRNLPLTIRSVYVPMVKNHSTEPGIEEELTRQIQEELMRDGNLLVRNLRDADMVLSVVLKNYDIVSGRFSSDRFPETLKLTMAADALLYNVEDIHYIEPLHSWRDITREFQYGSDPRRVTDVLDVDARRQALSSLAQKIVQEVIYKPSDEAQKREKRIRQSSAGKLKR